MDTINDYKKYIIADSRDIGSRQQLLKLAIENAKKREGRVSGYRKLNRKQLYRIMQKDEKENSSTT